MGLTIPNPGSALDSNAGPDVTMDPTVRSFLAKGDIGAGHVAILDWSNGVYGVAQAIENSDVALQVGVAVNDTVEGDYVLVTTYGGHTRATVVDDVSAGDHLSRSDAAPTSGQLGPAEDPAVPNGLLAIALSDRDDDGTADVFVV